MLDLCIDEMLEQVIGRGYHIIVRPHPEYIKRYGARWEALQQRFASVPSDELYFESDFSSNDSIFAADVMVTDWSSISCEFSFTTLKPTLFVDTPMKVGNPEWKDWGLEPTDLSLRNQIGISLKPEKIKHFGETVDGMIASPEKWRTQIEDVRQHFLFNLGTSAQVAGEFLLAKILQKQREKFSNAPMHPLTSSDKIDD